MRWMMKSMSMANEMVPPRAATSVVKPPASVAAAFCTLSSGCGGIFRFFCFWYLFCSRKFYNRIHTRAHTQHTTQSCELLKFGSICSKHIQFRFLAHFICGVFFCGYRRFPITFTRFHRNGFCFGY